MDSRVPPELIFDQGLGELFVIRTAGEVQDQAVFGNLEFGVVELQIPLLVVLGHERCGAIKATIEVVERQEQAEADIAYIVEALTPAVEQGDHSERDLWENARRAQVALQVERLRRTPVLAKAAESAALKVVGIL